MSLNSFSQKANRPGSRSSDECVSLNASLIWISDRQREAILVGLFGVFDGNGGSRAADNVKQNLSESMPIGIDPEPAIAETYRLTDQDHLEAQKNSHKEAGSTASSATLVGANSLNSNIGDSTTLLSGAQHSMTGHDGLTCAENKQHRDTNCATFPEAVGESLGRGFLYFAASGAKVMIISANKQILLGVLVGCLPQLANAQQLTSNGTSIDPTALLTSDAAKGALIAGGLGAFFAARFIWKRFFCRPPTFTVADINAGLEDSPSLVRREDLLSILPRINKEEY